MSVPAIGSSTILARIQLNRSLNWFNEEPRLLGQGLRDPYLPSLYLSATFDFPPTLLVLVKGILGRGLVFVFGFDGVLSEDLHGEQIESVYFGNLKGSLVDLTDIRL